MLFKEMLIERASSVENVLKEYLPIEDGYQKTIKKAMNYSLMAGGKRLRPILTIEACKMVDGNQEDVVPFAVAIEMIHTYSLIHDDLPALDNDDLRRGRPTNHKVFGEAMSILAGDSLLNYAYEIMLKSSIGKSNSNDCVRAMYEIAKSSGINGMIGGQVVDVESENKLISKDKLDYIHKNKTAKIIIGCMRAGAIIGQAEDEELKTITNYAENIGLAFQIMDDILDIVGDEKKLGKKVNSDINNKKSTYPSLLGLNESKKIAMDLVENAKYNLTKTFKNSNFLYELANYIISREC